MTIEMGWFASDVSVAAETALKKAGDALDKIKEPAKHFVTISVPLATSDALWQAGSVREFSWTDEEGNEFSENFIAKYWYDDLPPEVMSYLVGPFMLGFAVFALAYAGSQLFDSKSKESNFRSSVELGIKMFGAVLGWNAGAALAEATGIQELYGMALFTGFGAAVGVCLSLLAIDASNHRRNFKEYNERSMYFALFVAVLVSGFLWNYGPDAALSMDDGLVEGSADHALASAGTTFAFAAVSFSGVLPLAKACADRGLATGTPNAR